MATSRVLISRPIIRASSLSGSGSSHPSSSSSWMREPNHNGEQIEKIYSKWYPIWLVAGTTKKTTKMSGPPEAAVQSLPLISLVADDVPPLWASVVAAVAQFQKPTTAHVQMLIEKGIVDCRFFTSLAVAGSLLGSILCFLEGCFMILKSYFKYFHALTHKLDTGCVVHLLIEAIDMFLMGTAMLIFGMGLYTMFIGPEINEGNRQQRLLPKSNLFGLFSLKMVPSWVEMQSLSQAKSRVGHAVMMILQVGVLEKFKSIPLVTTLDLACFAGALVISSASIFVLAQLSISTLQRKSCSFKL